MLVTDVGDGCWRRNVLVTIIRCWWQFWPFWSPTFNIFLLHCSVRHQHSNDVTNILNWSPILSRQHHDVTNITFTTCLIQFFWVFYQFPMSSFYNNCPVSLLNTFRLFLILVSNCGRKMSDGEQFRPSRLFSQIKRFETGLNHQLWVKFFVPLECEVNVLRSFQIFKNRKTGWLIQYKFLKK